MMTVPDGSAESFTETDQLGWIALNVEHPIASWSTCVSKAQQHGVKVIPWVRLAHVEQGDTIVQVREKLELLVKAANIWNTDWILPNYEVEAATIAPATVAAALKQTGWNKNTGWSMIGWLLNDVNYRPVASDPVLLQIFPSDFGWPKDYATIKTKMGDCVSHARDHGFTYVGVTYQTYDDATPALFDVESYQHSVFTGNVIQPGQWGSWFQ